MALDYIYGYVVAVWSSSFFTALLFGWYRKTVVKTKLGFFFFLFLFLFFMLFSCFSFFFFLQFFFFCTKAGPSPCAPKTRSLGAQQPRSQSSLAISDVTSPVKLVGKIRAIALGSKLPLGYCDLAWVRGWTCFCFRSHFRLSDVYVIRHITYGKMFLSMV